MITDYTTLKASIASFMHRTDLDGMIPEFIADGEARIYNDLRVRAMEASFSSAITGTVALPAGFLEWINLYIDGDSTQKLQRKDAEWIYTNYPTRSGSAKPVFFAREGETLIFGPYPGSAYTAMGRYYKRLDALSDTNTSNWFTANQPELLRFAALCEAAPYIMDDARTSLWEGKYAVVMNRIKRTERRESVSGSILTTRAG